MLQTPAGWARSFIAFSNMTRSAGPSTRRRSGDWPQRLLGRRSTGGASPIRDELVDAALRLIGQMAQNEALAASLSGPRWHEVPLAYHDGQRIWRGALDALVAIGPGPA